MIWLFVLQMLVMMMAAVNAKRTHLADLRRSHSGTFVHPQL